jgi:hypothetical protein
MKNPLLAALLASALLAVGCGTTPAPAPEPEPIAQPEPQVTEADFVAQERRRRVEPAPEAPRRYVVQRGDTLWDISTMFLRDPWLWPEIWHINPQIRNPHLIYPGDVIILYFVDGVPHIRIERDNDIYQITEPVGVERLSPRIRIEPLEEAVPFIPMDAIWPLLRRPRLITDDQLDDAGYLLRSVDGRLMTSAGDRIYARNLNDEDETAYLILRRGAVYRDPETRRRLGYEAIHVGEARLERHGDPATLEIDTVVREAREGDLLIPLPRREIERAFYPSAPEARIDGRIIDVLEGVTRIGQYQTVVLNRGARQGLERGHVLDIWQAGESIRDRHPGRPSGRVRLPDERAGILLVYRIFDEVSYALVMQATQEVAVGDMVRNPADRIVTPREHIRRGDGS